jgi:hypothetical protein
LETLTQGQTEAERGSGARYEDDDGRRGERTQAIRLETIAEKKKKERSNSKGNGVERRQRKQA